MFNFFKSHKSTINSVKIPNFGWEKETENPSIIKWINDDDSLVLSLNFFDMVPNIPSITDLTTLRNFYRNSITQAQGGLIEVEMIDLKGYVAIRTIFKISQQPRGMIYLASLTIPFAKCSYVVKIQAAEVGFTGMREAVMTEKLLCENKISIGENGLENWFSDPYNADFKSNCLMNQAEKAIYDDIIPNHPLSQARKLLAEIELGIELKTEIQKNKAFKI
jgi:hypothetical protein